MGLNQADMTPLASRGFCSLTSLVGNERLALHGVAARPDLGRVDALVEARLPLKLLGRGSNRGPLVLHQHPLPLLLQHKTRIPELHAV